MNKEVKDILNQRRKLMVLEYAKAIGSVSQTCQDLGIARSSFYEWKNAFEQEGKSGLLRKKPIPKNHPIHGYPNNRSIQHLIMSDLYNTTKDVIDVPNEKGRAE